MAKSEEKELNRYRFDTENVVWGVYSYNLLQEIEYAYKTASTLELGRYEVEQLYSILEQLKVFK